MKDLLDKLYALLLVCVALFIPALAIIASVMEWPIVIRIILTYAGWLSIIMFAAAMR